MYIKKTMFMLVSALILSLMLISCKGEARMDKSKGVGKLLESIEYNAYEYNASRRMRYDEQNRIKGIVLLVNEYEVFSAMDITYHKDGSISVYDHETFYEVDFTRKGNTITIVENESTYPAEILTINKSGFITKRESLGEGDGGWRRTTNYQYQNGNPIKVTTETLMKGTDTKTEVIENFKFDDKISPFYSCNTPRWLLQFFGFSRNLGLKNNVVEYQNPNSNGGQPNIYNYEYDSYGYLYKSTASGTDDDGNECPTVTTYIYGE